MDYQTEPVETSPIGAQSDPVTLMDLRIELQRMVENLRMHTKRASAEAQHVFESLDEQVKKFACDVVSAAADRREELKDAGYELRMRVQKLANQLWIPR